MDLNILSFSMGISIWKPIDVKNIIFSIAEQMYKVGFSAQAEGEGWEEHENHFNLQKLAKKWNSELEVILSEGWTRKVSQNHPV